MDAELRRIPIPRLTAAIEKIMADGRAHSLTFWTIVGGPQRIWLDGKEITDSPRWRGGNAP